MSSTLYIWVEGSTDKLLFEKIQDAFLKKYRSVKYIQYASLPKKKRIKFLNGIMNLNADYIYFTDIDDSPSVMSKINEVRRILEYIDSKRVVIVISEIESWYLAGLTDEIARKTGISVKYTRNNATKEEFNRFIPRTYRSRISFMKFIMKHFSIITAAEKNKSFKYFYENFLKQCDLVNETKPFDVDF